MGSRMVWVPVVSGPLAPYAAGFESWLASRAYSASAAADRLYQFDQLSRWLGPEQLSAGELTGEQAGRFAAGRRAAGLKSTRTQWPDFARTTALNAAIYRISLSSIPADQEPHEPIENTFVRSLTDQRIV